MTTPTAKDIADACEIARFGGLTGAQGEGLAQIVAVIRADAAKAERERVLFEMEEALAPSPFDEAYRRATDTEILEHGRERIVELRRES